MRDDDRTEDYVLWFCFGVWLLTFFFFALS